MSFLSTYKQTTAYIKQFKHRGAFRGPEGVHIKAEDYGTTNLGSVYPLTNRFMKRRKLDDKIVCRAAKRGEKHRLKKEIEFQIEDSYENL